MVLNELWVMVLTLARATDEFLRICYEEILGKFSMILSFFFWQKKELDDDLMKSREEAEREKAAKQVFYFYLNILIVVYYKISHTDNFCNIIR